MYFVNALFSIFLLLLFFWGGGGVGGGGGGGAWWCYFSFFVLFFALVVLFISDDHLCADSNPFYPLQGHGQIAGEHRWLWKTADNERC